MNINERINFLRSVTIFSEAPEELLRNVAEQVSELEVAEGDQIVLKGEQGNSMYFITLGQVKVHDGDHLFARLKEGNFFGKYYLIDHKERSATVTALETCRMLTLDNDLFRSITNGDNAVVTGILKTLVARLRDMNIAEEQLASQNRKIESQKMELERQRVELLELNATKDKFFSIIAHDLRSPITTLISLSEVLRTEMGSLTPEQNADILTSLYDLSKNYLKLLDNLLQWSRMQTGRLIAEPEQLNLADVIAEIETLARITAVEKQIRLENRVHESALVFADLNMIRTVLRNLVSNALKYTQGPGAVVISSENLGTYVEVSIADTGVGMTPEMIGRLFLLDKTFSTRGTANEKGTGLGLVLCKEFLKKNGGSLRVKSEPGLGSTFYLTLPIYK